MTRVQQRGLLVFAAFVLAIGCCLAAIVPQQQAHALTAGTTFAKATSITPVGKQLLTKTGTVTFNSTNDNNYFKFTTSNRNSRYRLNLAAVDGDRFFVTLYDKNYHRIAYMSTNKVGGQSWVFKNLKQSSTYYVEVWRYALNVADYLDSGTTLGESYAEKNNARYMLKLKEIITKPGAVTKLKIRSKKAGVIQVKYNDNADATGFRIEVKKKSETKWSYIPNYYLTTPQTEYDITKIGKTNKTMKALVKNKKYQVRVRAYRKVNGKFYSGPWTVCNKAIKANGKTTSWV